jgi:hypothetical protein
MKTWDYMEGMRAEGRVKDARRTGVRVKACRAAAMIVFTLLLTGCDSCGDFISPIGHAQVCRKEAPQPH